jgi:hypothetical protein
VKPGHLEVGAVGDAAVVNGAAVATDAVDVVGADGVVVDVVGADVVGAVVVGVAGGDNAVHEAAFEAATDAVHEAAFEAASDAVHETASDAVREAAFDAVLDDVAGVADALGQIVALVSFVLAAAREELPSPALQQLAGCRFFPSLAAPPEWEARETPLQGVLGEHFHIAVGSCLGLHTHPAGAASAGVSVWISGAESVGAGQGASFGVVDHQPGRDQKVHHD